MDKHINRKGKTVEAKPYAGREVTVDRVIVVAPGSGMSFNKIQEKYRLRTAG